ncbi:MAG TPA: cell division protein CrgA [Acidimicrobiales bacterium]|nr:cell division protein CrgA [Acidimicrobiales bacterium]
MTPSRRSQEPGGGRYTPPVPRVVKRSPRWYPWMLLAMLVIGVVAIILNYTEVAPWSPNSGYLVGGILCILVAALLSTRYH